MILNLMFRVDGREVESKGDWKPLYMRDFSQGNVPVLLYSGLLENRPENLQCMLPTKACYIMRSRRKRTSEVSMWMWMKILDCFLSRFVTPCHGCLPFSKYQNLFKSQVLHWFNRCCYDERSRQSFDIQRSDRNLNLSIEEKSVSWTLTSNKPS